MNEVNQEMRKRISAFLRRRFRCFYAKTKRADSTIYEHSVRKVVTSVTVTQSCCSPLQTEQIEVLEIEHSPTSNKPSPENSANRANSAVLTLSDSDSTRYYSVLVSDDDKNSSVESIAVEPGANLRSEEDRKPKAKSPLEVKTESGTKVPSGEGAKLEATAPSESEAQSGVKSQPEATDESAEKNKPEAKYPLEAKAKLGEKVQFEAKIQNDENIKAVTKSQHGANAQSGEDTQDGANVAHITAKQHGEQVQTGLKATKPEAKFQSGEQVQPEEIVQAGEQLQLEVESPLEAKNHAGPEARFEVKAESQAKFLLEVKGEPRSPHEIFQKVLTKYKSIYDIPLIELNSSSTPSEYCGRIFSGTEIACGEDIFDPTTVGNIIQRYRIHTNYNYFSKLRKRSFLELDSDFPFI